MPQQLWEGLARRLRAQVRAGKLAPGTPLPSRRELAARFGVSGATIQRVMDDLITDGYVSVRPRHATIVARHPPHRHRLGLVLPAPPDPSGGQANRYLAALQLAAARPLPGHGKVVLFHAYSHDPRPDEHRRLVHAIAHHAVAGVLLPAPWTSDQWLVPSQLNVPAVVTTREYHGAQLHRVIIDQRRWIDAALDRLQAVGVRSAAAVLVAGTETSDMVAHLEAGMAARGIASRPWWVIAVDLRFPHWVSRVVEGMIAGGGSVPDALLVLDDNLLLPALAGLHQSGRSGDVRVLTHCNYPYAGPTSAGVETLGWDAYSILALAFAAVTGGPRPTIVEAPLRLGTSDDPGSLDQ